MDDHRLRSESPSPALPSVGNGSGSISHRSSFAENMRASASPRAQRHPSLTQSAIQSLIDHPPSAKGSDPRFAGRDWRSIRAGELVRRDILKWTELGASVEEASKILTTSGAPNVVLVREKIADIVPVATFDYTDLNTYLLMVVGLGRPEEDQRSTFEMLQKKAQSGETVVLREVLGLAKKEAMVSMSESDDLKNAIRIFGGGVHRILITKEGSVDVIGMLSQLQVVQFLWENGPSFPTIDAVYPMTLRDLNIGTHSPIAINGDRMVTEALDLMCTEGLSSIAVVDNSMNVVGNISTVDVKLLTNTSQLPLLHSTCIQFISKILNERGMADGKDSFPVFHVNDSSTLAHTVAKLVATRSHRMWVVDSGSPSTSIPSTPLATPSVQTSVSTLAPTTPSFSASNTNLNNSSPPSPSLASAFPPAIISAAANSGSRLSGHLVGVVSLTDVLNLFARQSGLHPSNPNDQREARRRRSSSSSVRPSLDFGRRGSSFDIRR